MPDDGEHDAPTEAEVADAVEQVIGDGSLPGDALRDAAGRLRLSFTRVDTFERCPRRFRYQYVDGLPQAPAPQLSFGTSIHATLEWLFDRKHPVLPGLEETLQALYDAWETEGYAEVDRSEQLAAYAHAREVVTRFHQRLTVEGLRSPVATEAWFELPLGDDIVVVGSIDRLDVDDEGVLHVVDYKTNRRARTRAQVRDSLQLAVYALATRELFGRLPGTVALDFVVPGIVVTVPTDELDVDGVHPRLAAVATRIVAGEDTPTPHRLCDWCDFRAICPAWSTDTPGRSRRPEEPEVLGRAVAERDALRRSLVRGARRLRQLDRAVDRLTAELADG